MRVIINPDTDQSESAELSIVLSLALRSVPALTVQVRLIEILVETGVLTLQQCHEEFAAPPMEEAKLKSENGFCSPLRCTLPAAVMWKKA